MTSSSSRRVRATLIVLSVALVAIFLLLGAFPVGWFKNDVEKRLTLHFGGTTRIGTLERETIFSFSPVVRIVNMRIPQQRWAGSGDLATIGLLRVRVHVLPLLVGRTDIDVLTASAVRLDLVRTADGQVNWRKAGDEKDSNGGGESNLSAVGIRDAVIRYRDAKQKRAFTLSLATTPVKGLVVNGSGTVDGAPVTVNAKGAPMTPDRAWPFEARIDGGAALNIQVKGSMAAPLRTSAMNFHVTTRADDLKRADRIIEAGLFGTQPINLSADVERKDGAWIVKSLAGTIGRSTLRGNITVHKVDGRSKLDGDVRFGQLDFADLASDAGLAKAAALRRAQGLRLVPNTRINIRKIDKTDGRIAVRIDRVVPEARPSALTDITAVLNLDNRILTVEPLRIGLTKGAITGKVVVNQRDGQPSPRVTMALDMKGSSIATLAGSMGSIVDGRMDARVRLSGVGDTIREAVGRSDGTVGIAAQNGTLPAKIAALIGFDLGRGMISEAKGTAALRCAIVRLDMKNGTGTFAPLLIDTSTSQTRGTGAISFPNETIAATLTGAPKQDTLLVVPGHIIARGTIREPSIVVPEKTKSVGNVLKAIGRAITGHNEILATNADCATLSRRAIGR